LTRHGGGPPGKGGSAAGGPGRGRAGGAALQQGGRHPCPWGGGAGGGGGGGWRRGGGEGGGCGAGGGGGGGGAAAALGVGRGATAVSPATADIWVCPSRHEPLGNVVLEAWSAGRPVVATTTDGPRELIRPDADGLLVPPEDPGALAGAVGGLLKDADRARSLA